MTTTRAARLSLGSLGDLSPRLGSAAPSWRSLCGAWWPCLSRTQWPQRTSWLPLISHRRELRPRRGLSVSPSHPRSQILWAQGRVGGRRSWSGATLLLTLLHRPSAPAWLLIRDWWGRDCAWAGRGFGQPAGRALVNYEALWFSGDSGAAGHSLGSETGPMGSDMRGGVFPLPPSFPERLPLTHFLSGLKMEAARLTELTVGKEAAALSSPSSLDPAPQDGGLALRGCG